MLGGEVLPHDANQLADALAKIIPSLRHSGVHYLLTLPISLGMRFLIIVLFSRSLAKPRFGSGGQSSLQFL